MLVVIQNKLSKGLIINVIKLNGYTNKLIKGTTMILSSIDNIFISQLFNKVIGILIIKDANEVINKLYT